VGALRRPSFVRADTAGIHNSTADRPRPQLSREPADATKAPTPLKGKFDGSSFFRRVGVGIYLATSVDNFKIGCFPHYSAPRVWEFSVSCLVYSRVFLLHTATVSAWVPRFGPPEPSTRPEQDQHKPNSSSCVSLVRRPAIAVRSYCGLSP